MEGKIDARGLLNIKRAEKWKEMTCPWCTVIDNGKQLHTGGLGCGDHCPHFGEPEKNDGSLIESFGGEKQGAYTTIYLTCGGDSTLIFPTFADERGA